MLKPSTISLRRINDGFKLIRSVRGNDYKSIGDDTFVHSRNTIACYESDGDLKFSIPSRASAKNTLVPKEGKTFYTRASDSGELIAHSKEDGREISRVKSRNEVLGKDGHIRVTHVDPETKFLSAVTLNSDLSTKETFDFGMNVDRADYRSNADLWVVKGSEGDGHTCTAVFSGVGEILYKTPRKVSFRNETTKGGRSLVVLQNSKKQSLVLDIRDGKLQNEFQANRDVRAAVPTAEGMALVRAAEIEFLDSEGESTLKLGCEHIDRVYSRKNKLYGKTGKHEIVRFSIDQGVEALNISSWESPTLLTDGRILIENRDNFQVFGEEGELLSEIEHPFGLDPKSFLDCEIDLRGSNELPQDGFEDFKQKLLSYRHVDYSSPAEDVNSAGPFPSISRPHSFKEIRFFKDVTEEQGLEALGVPEEVLEDLKARAERGHISQAPIFVTESDEKHFKENPNSKHYLKIDREKGHVTRRGRPLAPNLKGKLGAVNEYRPAPGSQRTKMIQSESEWIIPGDATPTYVGEATSALEQISDNQILGVGESGGLWLHSWDPPTPPEPRQERPDARRQQELRTLDVLSQVPNRQLANFVIDEMMNQEELPL